MEHFFGINKKILTCAGLWPYPNEKKKYYLVLILAYFNNAINIYQSTAEFLYVIYNIANVINLSEGICIFITGLQNISKITLFIVQRKLFWQLIEQFDDLYESTPLPNTNEFIVNTTKKWKQVSQYIVKLLLFLYNLPITSYLILPWYIYYNDGIRKFPFPSHFPFDTSEFNVYFPLYMIQFILGYLLLFVFAGCDGLFGSIAYYVTSRIEVLMHCLETATNDAADQQKKTPLFNACMMYHQKLLHTCELVEELFSPMLLFQFFVSTITICSLFFLTTLSGIPLEKKFAFLSYFITMSTQLFIFCYFGQLIQSKFEEFEKTVTYFKWYETPLVYQRDMKFFLARCGKPMILTAYKIMPLNLETFLSIYKTSLSYLAMLQNMQEEDE